MFIPCLQQANANPWPSTFVVQLLIRSGRTLGDLRKDGDVQVSQAGPQFVYQMEDSTEQLARSTQQERTLVAIAGTFAALTILLTGVGLSAFSSYLRILRAREMAIRASLGAGPRQISRVMVREITVVLVAGFALDIVATLLTGQALRATAGMPLSGPGDVLTGAVIVCVTRPSRS